MQSRTAQVSVRLSPINRTPTPFRWSGAYTYTAVREKVSGFNSTAGNPLDVEWSRSGQGPHQISYNLSYNFARAVTVNWSCSDATSDVVAASVNQTVNSEGANQSVTGTCTV